MLPILDPPLTSPDVKTGDFDVPALPAATAEALYVHVPFCVHKCHYCDFYSITGQSSERMTAYVDRTLREADLWRTRVPQVTGPMRTVFFGGGTPSLLPIGELVRLIVGLRDRLPLAEVDEWTIECNPATVNGDDLRQLHDAGVTRLSFGAQSFHTRDLQMLERHHDPRDVDASVAAARTAGFDRINLDLIFAIPGQSLADWQANLDRALAIGTTHLSCYGLTYEPNTPITMKKKLGTLTPAEDSLELEMLSLTRERLTAAGLPPYEISNYAAPGQECRHNLVYWSGSNYLSLGPSAASHVEGRRWKNHARLAAWENGVDAGTWPVAEHETLGPAERAGELAMLALRLTRGLIYADYAKRTGYDGRQLFADVAARFSRVGLITADDAGIRLTEKGLPVADAIAGEFLSVATDQG